MEFFTQLFPSCSHLLSFYFFFLFHIYRSLTIILCFSIDSMQLWDYKSVLHSICRFPCLLWFTSFTSFPLHFDTILLLPLCFLSFLFGDSFSFQFLPFKLCFMSCSCFLLHVSSIFHRLQSFSTVAWVKLCQTPLQNAMKLHAMRVVVWVSFPHCFNAISPIGLCLRVS